MLLGTLPYSGRSRGVICPATEQAYLVEAMDGVMRRLGGTARYWRVDRMSTVVEPKSGDVQASFAPVAKHYGAAIAVCPPRRGNRKGCVEAAVRYATGRWWRTLAAEAPEAAQVALDRFWAIKGDSRLRSPRGLEEPPADGPRPRWPSVGELAGAEPLLPLPAAPYPATVEAYATVDHRASVAWRGNRYSVMPGTQGMTMKLRHRLGTNALEIYSGPEALVVTHQLAPAGAGEIVRTPEHKKALEKVVLGQFSSKKPCDHKENRPPGAAALAERAKLLGAAGAEPAVDLDELARVIYAAFPGATAVTA